MRKFLLVGLAGLAIALVGGAGTARSSSAQTIGNQVCSTSGFFGYGSGQQATCQVTASVQLSPPNTVVVVQSPFVGASPVGCTGTSNASYATQGNTVTQSGNILAYAGGQTSCEFTVIAGTAPAGSYLGTETLSIPSTASGSVVQLNTFACGDPTCASGVNAFAPPSPPTLVTINNSTSPVAYSGSTVVSSSPNQPQWNPAWNTSPNPCFHAAFSADPCNNDSSSGHHHHHDDNGGDSDNDGN
jgi:hypothetical protein